MLAKNSASQTDSFMLHFMLHNLWPKNVIFLCPITVHTNLNIIIFIIIIIIIIICY